MIKDTLSNEGTLVYSEVIIKQSKPMETDLITGKVSPPQSAIKIGDTRGQIWMDDKEQSQLNILIDGKVKDMS